MAVSELRSRPARLWRAGRLRPRAARLLARIPPRWLAYAIPAVVAAAAVQTWFTDDTVLAGGDLAPPVATGADHVSHWNHENGGEGSPSYAIVSLPFVGGVRLASWLGLAEPTVQRLWLTLLVAGVAVSVVFLARALALPPLAAAVAGFVALFNGHWLATGFDPVPLAAMVAAAVLGGLVIRAGTDAPPRGVVFALASVLLGVVFANPALVALVLAWVGVCVLICGAVHGRQALARSARFLALTAPFVVVFNLWWLVPAAQTVTSDVFSDRFAAPGVDDWSWTHARASLANVIGLTSSWGWTNPAYFPFASRLERAPFEALQYVPAVAAALGLVLSGRRRLPLAAVLAAVGVASIVVMKGMHEPFSGLNRRLYDDLPGFWLLRDPAKVGFVVALVFALLGAIAIARLLDISPRVGWTAAVVVVAGAVAYAHPLVTGEIVPDERPLLPPAHVRVPAEWRAAATYLDNDEDPGKVVVLPRLDYYQAPTTWGYYGASFLHRLISRPVIEVNPGGYYAQRRISRIVGALEARLLTRRDVDGALQALGARYVIVRRDLDHTFADRSLADPRVLARAASLAPTLRHMRTFGFIDLYEAPAVVAPEVYAAVPIPESQAADETPKLLAATSGVAVTPRGTALSGIASGDVRLVPVEARVQTVRARTGNNGMTVMVRSRADWGAEARVLRFPYAAPPSRLVAGDTDVVVSGERTVVVTPPLVRTPQSVSSRELRFDDALARRVGDCNRYDDRSPREVGIAARVVESRRPTLHLRTREHSACLAIPIDRSLASGGFRLRVDYRGIRGAPPRVCVWQEGPDECAKLPALDPTPGWHRLDVTLTPRQHATSLHLFLYADEPPNGVTETAYRAASVASSRQRIPIGVVPNLPLPEVAYARAAPSEFQVHVDGAKRPFLLVAAETYSEGWKLRVTGQDPVEAEHIRVNGYANGWLVPWTGSYFLTLEYEPERVARIARRVDLFVIPFGLMLALWRPRRRDAG